MGKSLTSTHHTVKTDVRSILVILFIIGKSMFYYTIYYLFKYKSMTNYQISCSC